MARFEDLPVEMVNSIFSQLVTPGHDPWTDYMTRFPLADTKTLLSLIATSRLCRSLALPILFHSINKSQKAKYILNMFDAHKDLAHLTNDLSLPFSLHSKCDHSDVQDIASRLGIGDSVDCSIHEGRPETAEASLALALCSRLERLRIQLPDHCEANEWKNDSFSTAFNLFRIISSGLETVPFLENLKHLECFTGKRKHGGRIHGIPRLLN
ncbi:hypothetical protein LB507_001511 [Fusarium sp. FIESC RH6]|nr:hypothetical protein LB507_001511 [Fusarium sp. FIESC RH6]